MKTYFELLWKNPAAARKALVALIGAVVQASLLLYPHATWVPVLVAVVTGLGVYHIRNATVSKDG